MFSAKRELSSVAAPTPGADPVSSGSSCRPAHGVRQSQDAMGQHGAHVREVERHLALALGELDLALRQVRARLYGQARKPGRGRGEDPSHHLVPSIKERIVNRFPIFLGGTDRTVELHQLALKLEEGGIIRFYTACTGAGLFF